MGLARCSATAVSAGTTAGSAAWSTLGLAVSAGSALGAAGPAGSVFSGSALGPPPAEGPPAEELPAEELPPYPQPKLLELIAYRHSLGIAAADSFSIVLRACEQPFGVGVWNSWVRGWVDVITYDGFGPQNPYGNTRLRGWACVNPELYAMGFRQPSTGVVVWQGGPPGQGVLLPTLSVEMEYRWDTVTYGACANPDSGFSIGVNWNQSLPPVFYVQYRGAVGFVMLEGRNTF